MSLTSLPPSTFEFLKTLQKNNNREWFNANKPTYQDELAHVCSLADGIIDEVSKFDVLEPTTGKKSLFRIYRDTRFSKDKTPYKGHFSGRMKRATAYRRGGYYFHFEPGNQSVIAGGFWGPNSADIKRVRAEIAADPDTFRGLITAPEFIKTFGGLQGEQVKTAPKGYKKDHPAIDLLRYKQYLLVRHLSDEEVMATDLVDKVADIYQNMIPFFDYMSAVLTTDENGVPLEGLE